MKPVLIYKSELLNKSETFIKAQYGAMTSFRPRFAGLYRATAGLALPKDAILLSGRSGLAGKLRARAYHLSGIAPVFHRQLAAFRPRLLHAHFAIDAAAALPLARRLRVPLVVTLHGYDVSLDESVLRQSAAGRRYFLRQRELWDRASLFLCVSEFIRSQALAAGFPESRLRVHRIGVDTTRFKPHNGERMAGLVLFVGRMTEKKGLEYLLRAMALVQRHHPQAELVAIGRGPLRQPLEALAQSLGVRCRFLGAQSSDEVARWLSRAALLCAPSVTAVSGDTEGLPIVLCEAQAAGVPVVSTFHAGIPEAVCHEETGLLVPERRPEALATAISRLLASPTVREEMGQKGAEWIRTHLDLFIQTRELEAIYTEVLEQFQPTRKLQSTL